jgi:hypothetical protein
MNNDDCIILAEGTQLERKIEDDIYGNMGVTLTERRAVVVLHPKLIERETLIRWKGEGLWIVPFLHPPRL